VLLQSGVPAAKKIESAIAGVTTPQGARFERSVLIDLGESLEDYSYILVDRHGFLVVHVEAWPGATLRGSSKSATWVARVKGAGSSRFSNPVRDNARRIENLKRALDVFGKRLPDEYFADLVVVYDADISGLSLNAASEFRVVNGFDAEEALRARYDFAVNPGALTREEVDEFAGLIRTFNRADDASARARFEDAKKPFLPPALRRRAVEVNVSDSAAGIAPMAPRIGDRYPAMVRPKRTREASTFFLLLALVGAIAVWLFLYGGLQTLRANVNDLLSSNSGAAGPRTLTPVSTGSAADVDRAKELLGEVDPDTYSKVVDLDAPEVAFVEEYTTYTWHYTDASARGGETWIALTIDEYGRLRGVMGP